MNNRANAFITNVDGSSHSGEAVAVLRKLECRIFVPSIQIFGCTL